MSTLNVLHLSQELAAELRVFELNFQTESETMVTLVTGLFQIVYALIRRAQAADPVAAAAAVAADMEALAAEQFIDRNDAQEQQVRNARLERIIGTVCGWVSRNGILALLQLMDGELSRLLYGYYHFRLNSRMSIVVAEYPDMVRWPQPQPVVCEQYGASLVVLYSRTLFFELVSTTLSLASVFRLQALYPQASDPYYGELATGIHIPSAGGGASSVPGTFTLGGELNGPATTSAATTKTAPTDPDGTTLNEFLRAFKLQSSQARWTYADGTLVLNRAIQQQDPSPLPHSFDAFMPDTSASMTTTTPEPPIPALGLGPIDYSLAFPAASSSMPRLRNDPVIQRSVFDENLSTSIRSGLLNEPEFTDALADYVTMNQQLIDQLGHDKATNVTVNETDPSIVYRETTNMVQLYDRPARREFNENLPGVGVPRALPGQKLVPMRMLPLLLERHTELYTLLTAVAYTLDQAFVSLHLRHLSPNTAGGGTAPAAASTAATAAAAASSAGATSAVTTAVTSTNTPPTSGRNQFLKRGQSGGGAATTTTLTSVGGGTASSVKRPRYKSALDPSMPSVSVRIETGHDYSHQLQRADGPKRRGGKAGGGGTGAGGHYSLIQYMGYNSGGSYGNIVTQNRP